MVFSLVCRWPNSLPLTRLAPSSSSISLSSSLESQPPAPLASHSERPDRIFMGLIMASLSWRVVADTRRSRTWLRRTCPTLPCLLLVLHMLTATYSAAVARDLDCALAFSLRSTRMRTRTSIPRSGTVSLVADPELGQEGAIKLHTLYYVNIVLLSIR